MATRVRESQVEDVLATYPAIARRVLALPSEPSLIARQMALPSGRLDLLYLAESRLTLVEIKVEYFQPQFIQQVNSYRDDLRILQQGERLIPGDIDAVLLCPLIPDNAKQLCLDSQVRSQEYDPEDVLAEFFQRFVGLSTFAVLRPSDHGLWNIHLINRVARVLQQHDTASEIASAVGLSIKSTANHLRFLSELRLVDSADRIHRLTVLGQSYVSAMSSVSPDTHISEEQATILTEFIMRHPFASPTIYGIFSIVEAVFNLSKNIYPVPWDLLIPYFRDHCGKYFQWSETKTQYHGIRMYTNYAIELGLLGQQAHRSFLTPMGVRFTLLLQLHKSIEMVDALQLK